MIFKNAYERMENDEKIYGFDVEFVFSFFFRFL